jgi:16S rRNA (adenine1518-N6/adenine1519-N6)-dimethyltransferase
MIRPKKYLGQHFLTDPGIARRIVEALDPRPGETVIEVGPGTGVLTSFLLEKPIRLIPVEIDPESVVYLTGRWPSLKEQLVEGDFLKLDLAALCGERFHVIGNFPYNISSQIFFRLLEYRSHLNNVVCMVQKEVAERITSPSGSKAYGILSVLLGAWFTSRLLFTVKPGSFHPPPSVTSAVIRLERNTTVSLPCDEALFSRIVKTTFNQRRKMIRNSIRPILLNLDSNFELLDKRPEQLNVPQFVELTRWTAEQMTGQNNGPMKNSPS